MLRRVAPLSLSLLLWLVAGPLAGRALASDPFFTGVGDLAGGTNLSAAQGVSGDGSVVCGYSNSSAGDQAFRWTLADGIVGLGDLPGGSSYSSARAVSADGSTIVGDSSGASGGHAFRWRAPGPHSGGMQDLGDLPGGDNFSIANGVNADGSVVVGHSISAGSGTLSAEAFRWTDPAAGGTGIAALGDIPGSILFSVATACSADGAKVGGYGTSALSGPASSEAARWTAATGMVGLGDLPGGGFGGNAFGMSADGNTIVGLSAATGGVFAFRWSDPAAGGAGMESLGDIAGGSAYSRANGVSADGSVVVGQSVGTVGMEAFIWTAADGCRSLKVVLQDDLGLDLTGWTLEVATAISADGRTIVGYGPNPSGDYEGWVAHLGPEPPVGTWTDLGHDLAGSFGPPVLAGTGDLVAGTPVNFSLSFAFPASPIAWFIGASEIDAPFKGGVLVPSPTLIVLGNVSDGGGSFSIATTWPPGLPSQASLYFQMWIQDPAGPFGWSASNGLAATTP
jgi:probable HAF family extracellular repeat protein